MALVAVTQERYTIRHVLVRREPRKYYQKIVRLRKNKGLLVRNQLNYMYNGLDFELRRNIKKPKATDITINKNIDGIDDYKYNWQDYTSRRSTRKTNTNSYNQPNRYRNNNRNNNR